MKPVVSAGSAWTCTVVSIFAIIILSVLALLFGAKHHELVGGKEDPDHPATVAATLWVAVIVYAGFAVCCGLQGLWHVRESRRGVIAL